MSNNIAMSPSEALSHQTANDQPPSTRQLQKKTKEPVGTQVVRVTSPLTPWNDSERVKKRKSSQKCGGRQTRASKTQVKESKKKNKKESDKASDLRSRCQVISKPKNVSKFPHHDDINQYMKDYREEKDIKTKDDNGFVIDTYGPADVAKAYEGFVIPKISRISRLSNISKKGFLPPVKDEADQNYENPESDEEGRETAKSDSDEDFSDDEVGSEMLSPEAKEKRNKLNLSPLRKHVRLPDMGSFPVQTVTGLNLLELARLATTRTEYSESRRTDSCKRKTLSSEKKILTASLQLQEKVMCRVVDLTLPSSREFKVQKNPVYVYKSSEDTTPSPCDNPTKSGAQEQPENENPLTTRRRNLEASKVYDDVIAATVSTNRSEQSSVLSNALSSPSALSERSPTVREMLAAAVQDADATKQQSYVDDEDRLRYSSKFQKKLETLNSPKQGVPSQTNGNSSQKTTTKKVIKRLSVPEKHRQVPEGNSKSSVKAKSLNTSKNSADSTLPSLIINNSSDKTFNLTEKFSEYPSQNESAKLRKRARQRQEAVEKYEQFKRALALDKQKEALKLAILSKCDTVVKPRVSMRSVAM